MSKERVYVVTRAPVPGEFAPGDLNGNTFTQLVQAASHAKAREYMMPEVTSRIATQADLVAAINKGEKIASVGTRIAADDDDVLKDGIACS